MQIERCDILVVGSGIAGLSYAHHVSEKYPSRKILVITKGEVEESNSRHAQGGIATVLSRLSDSFDQHVQDTLKAGDGLCDKTAVETIVEEGPHRIDQLMEMGAGFDRTEGNELDLAREGGHSTHRIIHAGDHTGLEVQQTLLRALNQRINVELRCDRFAVDLILNEENACIGMWTITGDGFREFIFSDITVLATGGIGQVYQVTTNPSIATGDGIAMASRAGAELKNMAFVQFHPTALFEPNANPAFLISEAVRGFGAILRNERGEDFMKRYDARGSLATRDIVSRAVFNEMHQNNRQTEPGKEGANSTHVYLDLKHLDSYDFQRKFPSIAQKCRAMNLDISRDMIPVVPAAHYLCGGIKTDLSGRTSITNLLCIGESACTGMHGANRLASNSLLEALVMAWRAAEVIPQKTRTTDLSKKVEHLMESIPPSNIDPTTHQEQLRALMTQEVGIERSRPGLKKALETIRQQQKSAKGTTLEQLELRNLLEVARLIVQDSLNQPRSCGTLWFS